MPDIQQYAIVPFDGQPPAEAIVIGNLDAVLEYLPQSKSRNEIQQMWDDVARIRAHARNLAALEADFKDKVAAFNAQCDERLEALDARQRSQDAKRKKAKAREQQERVEAYLDALPDDDIAPPGDLTHNPPPDQERFSPAPDDAAPVKPVLSYGNVPMSYIKGKRDNVGDLPEHLEMRAPAPLGNYPTYDPAELGRAQDPKQVSQPVAVSLNEG